jgi:hypothetical protein
MLTGMKFGRFSRWLVPLYEVVRLLTLSLAGRVANAGELPLSWFAASPLLVFPLMLMVLYLFDTGNAEKRRVYARLVCLSKLMQTLGIVAWGSANVRAALPAAWPRVVLPVLFIVIDGILTAMLYKLNVRDKEETDVISD